MPDSADPVAAALAAIRSETAVSGPRFADTQRLLAAVSKVLKLHPVNKHGLCLRCDAAAAISCAERVAISRALLGEEPR